MDIAPAMRHVPEMPEVMHHCAVCCYASIMNRMLKFNSHYYYSSILISIRVSFRLNVGHKEQFFLPQGCRYHAKHSFPVGALPSSSALACWKSFLTYPPFPLPFPLTASSFHSSSFFLVSFRPWQTASPWRPESAQSPTQELECEE